MPSTPRRACKAWPTFNISINSFPTAPPSTSPHATTGLACNSDGTVVTTYNNQPVPDFLNGGPYSGLTTLSTRSKAYGAALQVTNTDDVAGFHNHFVGGASFDGSNSVFSGNSLIGGFDPFNSFFISPGVVQDQPSEGVNPVMVGATSRYYGLFAQDILSLTPALDLNLAGRFNYAQEDLTDLLGGPVNGNNTFSHFNPSAGLTYRISPALQVYGGYSVTNRAPTPQELSCSSAATPCSLLNFFVGDPPLQQVIADTLEVGARGKLAQIYGGVLGWNIDYYHTNVQDELVFSVTPSNPNLAFYTNAGRTLHQGVEVNLSYDSPTIHATLGYAYTNATFQSALLYSAAPQTPSRTPTATSRLSRATVFPAFR
jgi:iron complex outermembrane receptor protein